MEATQAIFHALQQSIGVVPDVKPVSLFRNSTSTTDLNGEEKDYGAEGRDKVGGVINYTKPCDACSVTTVLSKASE